MVRRFSAFGLAMMLATAAGAATAVPPGNRNAEQPAIPGASAKRTQQAKTTFEAKYQKVLALLSSDAALRKKIKATAARYGIDPLHMAGAIVGEHTYNVDAYDRLQTYYVKAASYLASDFSFSFEGEPVDRFVKRPQFAQCAERKGSYALWTCREAVWNRDFRGKTVGGTAFPANRFSAVFFQPFYAGQTFGLGQINPLTALQMSDLTASVSGLPRLDHRDARGVYEAIMDPDKSLAYMAAALKTSIDAYRSIADFDISANPGLTATLYNVGNPQERARALAAENKRRAAAGEAVKLPEENYYGWLVNDKLSDLKPLF